MSMIKRVTIAVASGRGVAERWRSQYQHGAKWTRTVSGDSEGIYKQLCDLGENPKVEEVANIIGNQGWDHLSCSGCDSYVLRAASYGTDYSERDILMCEACLREGLGAMSASTARDPS
jgi:hypothetical protein